MESLHARLKRETAATHGGLEAYIASRRLLTSLAGYTVFLRAPYAFQAEAEQAMTRSEASTIIADWHLRHRAHQARRDLETLGAAGTGQEPTPCGGLTNVAGTAGVLGVAYVIEGATLGGAVVDHWERLGIDPAEVVSAAPAAFNTARQHFEQASSGMPERQQQSA